MPDWIAHIMLGFSVATCIRMKGYQRVIFLIGNLMPDLVRFLSIFTRLFDSDVLYKFVALPINIGSHCILGVIVYGLVLSIFFSNDLGTMHGLSNDQKLIEKNELKFHVFDKFLSILKKLLNKPVFLLIFGGLVHLFLDTFMWPWASGLNWLYPLNGAVFEWSFKAFWPSDYDAIICLLPITLTCVVIEYLIFLKKKEKILAIHQT